MKQWDLYFLLLTFRFLPTELTRPSDEVFEEVRNQECSSHVDERLDESAPLNALNTHTYKHETYIRSIMIGGKLRSKTDQSVGAPTELLNSDRFRIEKGFVLRES